MGLRHSSIRLRVGILIVVPVLCLIGLYAFAASITLGNALTDEHNKALSSDLLTPVGVFQAELSAERYLALQNLAMPMNTQLESELGAQEANTTQALLALKAAVTAPPVADNASAAELQAIHNLVVTDARRLNFIRADVSDNAISIPATLNDYDSIEADLFTVLDQALDQESSVPLVTQALGVINMDRVTQTAIAESDLLAADMAQLRFPQMDRITFAELASQRQSLVAQTMPELHPVYRDLITASVTPSVSGALSTLERNVVSTPWHKGPPPAALVAGSGAFNKYTQPLSAALIKAGDELQRQSQQLANNVLLELILAAGVGLLGTIAAVALSLGIGRGLVRQLRELRESALTLAHEKLPNVITQLRAGEPVDVAEHAPSEISTSNEIEQVQHAFSVVQQTAIQSAVDEARLRRGISDVFRNLAGRSQSLLHRQLTLLDGMERRATEPDELEDLFRIDHLTTRMRRHAEGLVILSGDTPARGWRQPVPLVDVLRAAVAEVEDYTRIRVLCRTGAAIAGHAVADVIHLVAELAENATVFSPPNTPVRIHGDIVGRGLAVEIEDRGLGISQPRLDEINANLEHPPQFDLSGSDRLGLFIAGQLAQRHGVKITLRPSVYGGTTAIVLIPTSLVVEDDTYERYPALPAGREDGSQPDTLAGRHAAFARSGRRLGNGLGNRSVIAGLDQDYAGISLAIGGRTETRIEPAMLLPGRDDQDARFGATMPGPVGGDDQDARIGATMPGPASGDDQDARIGATMPGPASGDDGEDDRDAAVSTAMGAPGGGYDQDGGVSTTELGLPVRIRQASLAPQLRDSPPAVPPRLPGRGDFSAPSYREQSYGEPSYGAASYGPPTVAASPSGGSPFGAQPPASGFGQPADALDGLPAATSAGSAASPEAARNTMSALQRGWQLGRAEADQVFELPAEVRDLQDHDLQDRDLQDRDLQDRDRADGDQAEGADQQHSGD
jgi:signal transduction histidine kinase